MNPIKCSETVADIQPVRILSPVNMKPFFIAAFSGVGVMGESSDFVLYNRLAFGSEAVNECLCSLVYQDGVSQGLNSTKSPSASIRSISSMNLRFFSCSIILESRTSKV